MGRFEFVFILLSFLYINAFGNNKTNDSITNIEEVTITSNRLQLYSIGSTIVKIDSLVKNNSNTLSLADLMILSSGIAINNYGPGGVSTAIIRGATSSHTTIIWNDINIQSPMNGQFNLSLIPVGFLSNIFIQYGGAGVMYGSGPMSGIIHLSNENILYSPNKASISTSYGSFNTKNFLGNVKFGKTNICSSIKAFYQKSDNDFKFKNTSFYDKRIMKQSNAGYQQIGFMNENAYLKNSRTTFKSSFWIQNSEKQIQTPMSSTLPNKSHQTDQNLLASLNWKYIDSVFQFAVKSAYIYNTIKYYNEQDNLSNNHSSSLINELETKLTFTKKISILLGVNHTYEKAKCDGYSKTPQRNRISFYGLLKIIDILNKISLNIGARDEYVSYLTPLVYNIGLEYTPFHDLIIKGNYSRNYRIPTMNDLYWKEDAYTMGNPNLKPESGYSSDIGITKIFKSEHLYFETANTVFYNKIYNWIIWQPSPTNGKIMPLNKYKGNSYGFELRNNINYKNHIVKFSFACSYFYTYSKVKDYSNDTWKHVDYAPKDKLIVNFSFYYQKYFASYIHNACYNRWFLEERLPNYDFADFIIGKNIQIRRVSTTLQFRINNLWNSDYQIRANYAMPRRNYMLTLTFEMNNN